MTPVSDIMTKFKVYIIDPAILVVFALGFFLFIFGLVEFLWKLNEGGENSEGRKHMIWGLAGMLIMISVYGIIVLLDNTFNLGVFTGPDVGRANTVISAPFQ
ncbi:MAG: hypothetical protein RLZZ416_507 [Candidatus Parcubacteria bacterium]|jgi:hypothetical protein